MSEFPDRPPIVDLLRHVRGKIDKAVAIAQQAEILANDGEGKRVVSVSLGIEQPLYEATTFINAVNLIKRIDSD